MKVLVVSNMGPKKANPTLGLFVDKQISFLADKVSTLSYFYMKFNGDKTFHKLFKYPYFFISFIYNYIFSLKKYDIIHIHYFYPTIYAALLYKYLRNADVKVIVTCHGGDIYCYSPPPKLYVKLSSLVDHWVFTSDALRSKFFSKVDNASVICAGYDDRIFQYNPQAEKKYDCLLVGSLDLNKGLDRFINLIKRYPTISFAAVGSGPYQQQLSSLAVTSKNFTYLGSVDPKELSLIVASSHLLLSLSRNESFGLVISEAHALGVPCVATKTDGSSAQIQALNFLVDQNDEEQVVNDIHKSLKSYLSLSQQQQATIKLELSEQAKAFSLTFVSSKLYDCYVKLLGKKNV